MAPLPVRFYQVACRFTAVVGFLSWSCIAMAQHNANCTTAQELYKAGNYQLALEKQQECINARPNDGVGYYNRGRILYQMKEIPKALADYETATRMTPDFIQSYYALSEHYLGNKDFDNALKWISQAILAKPDMASNYNFRGWIYFNSEKYQLAFKDFTKAIDLNPKDASAYNNRGSARYKIQNVDEAVTKDLEMSRLDYERAMSLDSSLPHLYRNIGYVSMLLKEDSVALQWFKKAVERDPGDAMVYLYQGIANKNIGNTSVALDMLNKAIETYDKLGEAYYEKGKIFYKKKVYTAAKENFTKAVNLDETLKAEGYYYLAMCNATMFEADMMMDDLKNAQKYGYFKRQEHLVAFIKEPAFNDFRKQKAFIAFVAKLKGN